jgi:hypothetical protein
VSHIEGKKMCAVCYAGMLLIFKRVSLRR